MRANPISLTAPRLVLQVAIAFVASVIFVSAGSGFERKWINPDGGDFHDPNNWNPPSVPFDNQDAVFNLRQETPYEVLFSQDVDNFQVIVGTDNLVLDLGGFTYFLIDGIIVGGQPDDRAVFEVRNGILDTEKMDIAAAEGANGLMRLSNAEMMIFGDAPEMGGANNTFAEWILENNSQATFEARFWPSRRPGSRSRLVVRGEGSVLHAKDRIEFGFAGPADLLIEDGGTLRATSKADIFVLGREGAPGDRSTAIIDGGNLLVESGDLDLARRSHTEAKMIVRNGSTVEADRIYLARTGGRSWFEITDSVLATKRRFKVGHEGPAAALFGPGSNIVIGEDIRVGRDGEPGILSSLTVDGAEVVVAGDLRGPERDYTNALIDIRNKSTVEVQGQFMFGRGQGPGLGSMEVNVANATLTANGDIHLGRLGSGMASLLISESALVRGAQNIAAGTGESGSEGRVAVTGNGSVFQIDGGAFLGGEARLWVEDDEGNQQLVGNSGGFGLLEVSDGGRAVVGQDLFLWEGGSLRVDAGSIQAGGLEFSEQEKEAQVNVPVHRVPDSYPLELPVTEGLAVWYAADQLTGLNDGDLVFEWTDLSGNGRHATQPSVDARPVYVTDGLNGMAVLRFDGNNDYLATADFNIPIGQPNHVFIVIKAASTGRVFDRLADDGGVPDRQTFRYHGSNAHAWAGNGVNTPFTSMDPHLHEILFNGPDSYWHSPTFGLSSIASGDFGPNTMGGLVLGASRNLGEIIQADFAEMIVFERALDDEERALIENYLAGKYSLSVWSLDLRTVKVSAGMSVVLGAAKNPFIQVDGDVVLGGVGTLEVELAPGFFPEPGETFTLVSYTGSLSGNFAGLPEASVIELGGHGFSIGYSGGAVTLTEISASPGVGFADWISGFDLPPEEVGADRNPSGDGISNAMKYGLGLDPRVATRDGLPDLGILMIDDRKYLLLEVAKNPEASGAEYVVELSTDLVTWDSGAAHVTVIDDNASLLRVRSSTPIGAGENQFLRLVVKIQ